MLELLTPDGIRAAVAVGWLLLAIIVFCSVSPLLTRILKERAFTVEIAGFKLTAQETADTLNKDIKDLQDKVRALEAGLPNTSSAAVNAPHTAIKPAKPRRVIWVDDFPENNAFAVERLRSDGIEVVACESTAEGIDKLRRRSYGLVISDIGRIEGERNNSSAGIDLLKLIRADDRETPVIFFTSRDGVANFQDEAFAQGAQGITASSIELFNLINKYLTDTGEE